MTFDGHIERGRIVLDDSVNLPEGTGVRVHVERTSPTGAPLPGRLHDLFGSVRSGDPSSADNVRIDADLARAYQDMHQDRA